MTQVTNAFIEKIEKLKKFLEEGNKLFIFVPPDLASVEEELVVTDDSMIELFLIEDNLYYHDPYMLIDIDGVELDDDLPLFVAEGFNYYYYFNENMYSLLDERFIFGYKLVDSVL